MDHIADYLKFISSAPSFWFTLNTRYDHGCHLANRFRLETNDYEVLLIIPGGERESMQRACDSADATINLIERGIERSMERERERSEHMRG